MKTTTASCKRFCLEEDDSFTEVVVKEKTEVAEKGNMSYIRTSKTHSDFDNCFCNAAADCLVLQKDLSL